MLGFEIVVVFHHYDKEVISIQLSWCHYPALKKK